MGKLRVKPNYRRRVLRLPDLDHCKTAVLNSLGSPASRRVYEYAIDQFIAWYCSEPRLAFNRIVVVRYRMYLESRRLAHEAADAGLLSPELAAGITRVKGVKQLGFRSGNWLSTEQSSEVLKHACGDSMRARRDYAMLAMLFGCGFRRSELVGLDLDDIQLRQRHWAVVDLIGKGGHIRTVPIPNWVKAAAVDQWTRAANVTEGKIFRAVARLGKVWGHGISQNVVWYVVRTCCQKAGLERIAPHDLRRTCAKLCHDRGGELEQIQFLLPYASVQTTERYLGCNLGHPVNDLFDLRIDAQPQAKKDESVSAAGTNEAVETAREPGIGCHGGSEYERPIGDSKQVSFPEQSQLVEIGNRTARKAFDAALKREPQDVMRKAKEMAIKIRQPAEVWDLENCLTRRRKDIDNEYDFRASRLPRVFGTLLYEGRGTKEVLRGLRENKVGRSVLVPKYYLTQLDVGILSAMAFVS